MKCSEMVSENNSSNNEKVKLFKSVNEDDRFRDEEIKVTHSLQVPYEQSINEEKNQQKTEISDEKRKDNEEFIEVIIKL